MTHKVLYPLLGLAAGAMIYACTAEAPAAPELDAPLFGKKAKPHKVNMCHMEGNGGYHPIWIATKAMPAHAAHGDWEVTPEVCDGIDNNCGGWIDEGLCWLPAPPGQGNDYLFGPRRDFVGLEAEAKRLDVAMRAFRAVLDVPFATLTVVAATSDELTAAGEAFNAALEAKWREMVPDQQAVLPAHYQTMRTLLTSLKGICNTWLPDQFACEVEERPWDQPHLLGALSALPGGSVLAGAIQGGPA